MRRNILPLIACALLAGILVTAAANGEDRTSSGKITIDSGSVMFYPPEDTSRWADWREALDRWRAEKRAELNYDDTLYRRADLTWARRNFTCAFVMLWDEMWWDWQTGQFTPEQFLEDGQARFGGYDSVVLWHAYPRIGFDHRNQFDFYRDMPGGLEGLRKLVRQLHRHGVKVFIDYNPWDTGTRREKQDDLVVLAELVKAIEADGIFLDTLHHGSARFRQLLDTARLGTVLESELPLAPPNLHDHQLSWGQWGGSIKEDGPVGVARNKWFERRHMHHMIRRWQHDHTAELHAAWMNGVGMLVWENVFGQLRIWSARDQAILRAMGPIQRRFANHFISQQWTPLVPTATQGVYASRWESGGVRLWTLANRTEQNIEGTLLKVSHHDGDCYYDLIRGREIEPNTEHGIVMLKGRVRARGIGAFLAAPPKRLGDGFPAFIKRQAELERRADFDPGTPVLPEKQRAVQQTKEYTLAELPPGMVPLPATTFEMRVKFTRRECGEYQTPLKRTVKLQPYAIDATPVSNAEFVRFLGESAYKPAHPENFLKHWIDGKPTAGRENHPVVYVDLEDARAYAAWAGKRLPTEAEWQYAAGGPKGLAYPWGNQPDPGRCNHGQFGNTTTPVHAFPEGRSALGLYDMCGNTWEWTESERRDGRTRFCVIKGGSFYMAKGSHWYTDGGPQPTHLAAKFLMMWPGLDRCGTIGFRCVVDMKRDEQQ